MRLAGKTALITGSSRNIGKAIALAFAKEGANLVLNTRIREDELIGASEECRKLGVDTLPVLGDVSDPKFVTDLVEGGIKHFGKIDIVISNVAIRPHKPITEVTNEEWRNVMSVNLDALFYICKAVAPSMIQRRSGSIITIGGLTSISGKPNMVAICASKAGQLGVVRALAAELGPFGIRVNMVVPGSIETERRYPEWYPENLDLFASNDNRIKQIPLQRRGTPEEVAAACLFLSSDEASYITGDRMLCMGGSFIG